MSRSFRPDDPSDANLARLRADLGAPAAASLARHRPSLGGGAGVPLPPLSSLDLGGWDRSDAMAPRATSSPYSTLADYSITNPRGSISYSSGSPLPSSPAYEPSSRPSTASDRHGSVSAGLGGLPSQERRPSAPSYPSMTRPSSGYPRPSGFAVPHGAYRSPTSGQTPMPSAAPSPSSSSAYSRPSAAPYPTHGSSSSSRPDPSRQPSGSSSGGYGDGNRGFGPNPESAEEMRRTIENRKYREYEWAKGLTCHLVDADTNAAVPAQLYDIVFFRPSTLEQHQRTHTGERPFACPFPGCSQRFSTRSNQRRHTSLHEKQSSEYFANS